MFSLLSCCLWCYILDIISRSEIEWLYKEGASFLFPDKWEDFIESIPEVERGELVNAYYKR